MNGNDLAQKLYRVQGFVVVCGYSPREIGSLIQDCHESEWKSRVTAKMRVIDVATFAECNSQTALASGIVGIPNEPCMLPYHYKVEACD